MLYEVMALRHKRCCKSDVRRAGGQKVNKAVAMAKVYLSVRNVSVLKEERSFVSRFCLPYRDKQAVSMVRSAAHNGALEAAINNTSGVWIGLGIIVRFPPASTYA